MEFKDLVQMRRSHRKFTEEEIDGEDVKLWTIRPIWKNLLTPRIWADSS